MIITASCQCQWYPWWAKPSSILKRQSLSCTTSVSSMWHVMEVSTAGESHTQTTPPIKYMTAIFEDLITGHAFLKLFLDSSPNIGSAGFETCLYKTSINSLTAYILSVQNGHDKAGQSPQTLFCKVKKGQKCRALKPHSDSSNWCSVYVYLWRSWWVKSLGLGEISIISPPDGRTTTT